MTTWISGRIFGLDFVLWICYSSTFSRFSCLCRKQMRDLSKTCLATVCVNSFDLEMFYYKILFLCVVYQEINTSCKCTWMWIMSFRVYWDVCIHVVNWHLIACSGIVTERRLIILNNSCNLFSPTSIFCVYKYGIVRRIFCLCQNDINTPFYWRFEAVLKRHLY